MPKLFQQRMKTISEQLKSFKMRWVMLWKTLKTRGETSWGKFKIFWRMFLGKLRTLWGMLWRTLKYVLFALAILLLAEGLREALWQRAGIELSISNGSAISQEFLFRKLLVEYLTDSGVVTGFASIVLSMVVFSFERRQKEQERDKDISERLEKMRLLPFLQRLRKYIELEKEAKVKSWPKNRVEDLQKERESFSEREFLWEVGEYLRGESKANDLSDFLRLYDFYFTGHRDSFDALLRISRMNENGDVLALLSSVLKLWDDFDIDAKDVIVGALKRFSQKNILSNISRDELTKKIFYANRRRLLRDAEIRIFFPQLVNSETGAPPPVGYDAAWLHLHRRIDSPKILDWLKRHHLAANPFGSNGLAYYPFFPGGFARPDHWEEFLEPAPLFATCPTLEDARALAFQMRYECLPSKKMDDQGNEIVKHGREIFPIWVSFEQSTPLELPLPVLARSAARTWLDILPFSPDAMLDLLPARQVALLELLCWGGGSIDAVINLLKQAGLKEGATGNVIIHKLEKFESKFSSAHLPQDTILLSWLRLRPSDLNFTYLILPYDEFPISARAWWLEQFNSLMSTLFLNGIVTKIVALTPAPDFLSLPKILLSWSDAQLKLSLDSQFDVAVERKEVEEMGFAIRFPELFGPGTTEEQTTHKLISASHNSLARMCMLGNRLFKHHCEEEMPAPWLSMEELEVAVRVDRVTTQDGREETL